VVQATPNVSTATASLNRFMMLPYFILRGSTFLFRIEILQSPLHGQSISAENGLEWLGDWYGDPTKGRLLR
jgi:hypothetical protein